MFVKKIIGNEKAISLSLLTISMLGMAPLRSDGPQDTNKIAKTSHLFRFFPNLKKHEVDMLADFRIKQTATTPKEQ